MSGASPTDLEAMIGYTFKDPTLLKDALLHKSAAPHAKTSSFERLEFLGDRVLGLAISAHLLKHYPEDTERDLALRFARLTKRKTLANVADTLGLFSYLQTAKMPGATEAETEKIKADAMEALLGGLFLDKGFSAAKRLILKWWQPYFSAAATQDPKSALQEWSQKTHNTLPRYHLISQSGPAHKPAIQIRVDIETPTGTLTQTAEAGSRKTAETKAAQALLDKLKT